MYSNKQRSHEVHWIAKHCVMKRGWLLIKQDYLFLLNLPTTTGLAGIPQFCFSICSNKKHKDKWHEFLWTRCASFHPTTESKTWCWPKTSLICSSTIRLLVESALVPLQFQYQMNHSNLMTHHNKKAVNFSNSISSFPWLTICWVSTK